MFLHDIIQLKNEIKALKKQQNETETRSKQSLIKANYNEQYSRKNNIKIMNIREKQKETEEDLITEVCGIMQDKGVPLDPQKIMAIHRIPGKPDAPKPVLVKLTNNNEKSKIMRKRSDFKNAGNRLVDDVTKLNALLIQRLLEHSSIAQAWYFNGRVFGKTTDDKRVMFDLFDDVDSVLQAQGSRS